MFIFLVFETEEDRIKFERVFEKYQKLLLHKSYGILRDYDLAEDAVSEAFIRVYKNIQKIDDVGSSRTVAFLVTIVKNTSLTILKKRDNYIELDEFMEYEDTSPRLEDTVLSDVITSDMLKLVDNLKEELRAPFLLKYAHDLSHSEIAGLLGISENNATVRIHRAKAKLAELFREAGYANAR